MFQISPLSSESFSHLFDLPDQELRARGVLVRQTEAGDVCPCRISLRDAKPGERVLLLNYQHQDADTPYRSNYAIYVIDGAKEAQLAPGELPAVFMRRPIALRGYSADGMLVGAAMGLGDDIASVIEGMLANTQVAYLHAHNAMHGCYSARIDRAN